MEPLEQAMQLYPIGGTYEVDQKPAYQGCGYKHIITPKNISDYNYFNGNLSICGIGVFNKKNGNWVPIVSGNPNHYEIY